MITVHYFGRLKDELGLQEETLPWQEGTTDDFLNRLRARGESWEKALAPERIFTLAINEAIIHDTTPIKANDRVAILPPVTGG